MHRSGSKSVGTARNPEFRTGKADVPPGNVIEPDGNTNNFPEMQLHAVQKHFRAGKSIPGRCTRKRKKICSYKYCLTTLNIGFMQNRSFRYLPVLFFPVVRPYTAFLLQDTMIYFPIHKILFL